MAYHLFALMLISAVLVLAKLRRCSLYSPLVISASIWLMVFIAGLFFQDRFYPLQEQAFIAWLVWFFITSLIFFMFYPSKEKNNWVISDTRRLPFDYTVLLLVLIAWLSYRIWVLGSTGPAHFLLNLRLSSNALEGFEPMGLVGRFYPLVFAAFLFEHVYSYNGNRRLRFLLWGWMLLYAVATMGKFAILTPILSWVVIQGLKGQLKIRAIALLASFTVVLMLALHFTRAGEEDESTIVDILAIYIYSPLVALGYINIDNSLPFGAYVFRFFYAVGNYLSISSEPVEVILPYAEVPELTNVYTVMQPFYYDFGIFGVFFGAVFYGTFFAFLYSPAKRRLGLALVLFSGYSIVMIGQFIGDLLVTTLSGNIQLLLCVLFIFMVSKRIEHVG